MKKNHRILNFRKQQGVVIVVALFIVALVAAISYVMMGRLERDTRRNLLLQRDAQAAFYAQGSIIWALDQLKNNAEHKRANKLVDHVPIMSPETTLNGYQIKSTIYDMEDRFNINNLTKPDELNGFMRLLRTMAPDMNEDKAGELRNSIYDWLMQNSPDTALNKYYFNQSVPYRAAHQPIVTLGELNLVKGVTPQLYAALKPYLVALPVGSKINVSTATAPVLMTLSNNLTLSEAKKIIDLRNKNKITTEEAFLALPLVKNKNIKKENITLKSTYFLVETEVKIENQRTLLYTLLKRNDGDNKVDILWQSKNVY